MRKVTAFLGAALVCATIVASAQAPSQFKDEEKSHWAYEAMESLRAKNIVWGYPDGYFRGKRTLTRYEFAVALDRALKTVVGTPGPAGATGATGATGANGSDGAVGPAGRDGKDVSPEELATIKRLVGEFKDELARYGAALGPINSRLDRLTKELGDLSTAFNKAPKISGGAFIGIRSDRTANGSYVDYDGRFHTSAGAASLRNTPITLHQFQVGIDANIAGGAKLKSSIIVDNATSYYGGYSNFGGVNTNPQSQLWIDELNIKTPFGAIGQDSALTIGRYKKSIGGLTLRRPDNDRHFALLNDDPNYRFDGFDVTTHFGSVSANVFAGQNRANSVDNVAQMYGASFGSSSSAIFAGNLKPIGAVNPTGSTLNQLGGVTLGINHGLLGGGTLSGTAIAMTGTGGVGFNNGLILGADATINFSDRLSWMGHFGKSNTGMGRDFSQNARQNNAFMTSANLNTGGLNVSAGYKYIDPLFYAPGYWGRIGNWLNPTNIQGPTFRAGYDLSSTTGLTVGGDFFSAARGRAGSGGIGRDDEINRVLVGLRWDVSKNFRTTIDWEGVYWTINGAHSGIPANGPGIGHPTEQYINIGTGYNLTSNTMLKLNAQLGATDLKGSMQAGVAGLSRYSFNAFTTQVAVKF